MWRNTRETYGLVAIVLHWTIALLFIGQIGLGYLTQATSDQPRLQFDLYQWHKSFGFLILALSLVRAGWSLSCRKPSAVAGTPRWEATAASAMHGVLLALTLVVPVAGWAIASTSPLDIPSLMFNTLLIPDLPLTRSDAAEAFWSGLHAWLAYGAGLLVLAHSAAALHHHILRRDRTLLRMLDACAVRRHSPASRIRDKNAGS